MPLSKVNNNVQWAENDPICQIVNPKKAKTDKTQTILVGDYLLTHHPSWLITRDVCRFKFFNLQRQWHAQISEVLVLACVETQAAMQEPCPKKMV